MAGAEQGPGEHPPERGELRRAHDRLLRVLDSLPALVYVADLETHEVLYLNRYGRTAFGEVEGQVCWETMQAGQSGPCDFCTNDQLLDEAGEPAGVVEWELRNTRNGRHYLIRDQAIPWLDGRLVRLEIATDITRRKRAEEAAEARESELAAVFHNSAIAIAVTTAEGKFLRINQRYVEMFGYDSAEELRALTVRDVTYPEDREETRDAQSALASGRIDFFRAEKRFIRRDGSVFWGEVSVSPIRSAAGASDAFVAMIVDISDRKAAEERLQESEERFRVIVTHAQPIVFMLDREGRFLLSEGKSLAALGLAPGEVVGQSALEMYRDNPEILQGIRESLQGRVIQMSVRVGNAHFEVFFSPYHGPDGQVAGTLGMAVDVSDRVRAEEERRKLEAQVLHMQKLESLGVLAGGIAHDFNNILMTILGNADLALVDLSPSSPIRGHLDAIETAARRASRLCAQMLAYSGRGRFVVESLSLSELVREMTHMLEVSVPKKVALRYDFADESPLVEGDAGQISQIVLNLITNAAEAIGEDSGVIAVRTGAQHCDQEYLSGSYLHDELPEGTYAFLEVSDTGCGMDEETITRLFDPFYTTKFTGRGLGLSTVLGILRGHRGAIRVYTEPGKGSTFKVLLPALQEGGEETRDRRKTRREVPAPAGATVLLADDEEAVRQVGRRMLERIGMTVLCARDGQEAVEIFRHHAGQIGCVLLDLTMPRMSGEEAFREIRRIREDVPVILTSGYHEQEITPRFTGRGLAGFLQKPYQYQTLASMLARILRVEESS